MLNHIREIRLTAICCPYLQENAMSERKFRNKPARPAPPINALKKPSVRTAGNEPQEELMINISEANPGGAEKIDEPEDEVKLYVPSKAKSDDKSENKPKKSGRKGAWIAVIASLTAVCLGALAVCFYLKIF
jgi:hypothetical protein